MKILLVPFNHALCAFQSCQRIISADVIPYTGAGVIGVRIKRCLVWAVPIYCVVYFSSFIINVNAQAVNFVLSISFHCDAFLSGLLPFFTVYHTASHKNRTCKSFLPFWAGAGLLFGAAPLKCPGGSFAGLKKCAEEPEEEQDARYHLCTSILTPKLVKVRRCEIVTGSSPAVLIP